MTRSRIEFDWTTLLSVKSAFFALFRSNLVRKRSHVLDKQKCGDFGHFAINLRLIIMIYIQNYKHGDSDIDDKGDNDDNNFIEAKYEGQH